MSASASAVAVCTTQYKYMSSRLEFYEIKSATTIKKNIIIV